MDGLTAVAYLIAALLFIFGIRRLRSPDTARSGNTLSAFGMIIAVITTLLSFEIVNPLEVGIAIAIGAVIGAVAAQRVQMTDMPQMVAAFNGVGGGAAALVAIIEFYRIQELGAESEGAFITTTIILGVLIGSVSFAGSIIAFSKLQDLFLTGSVSFPLQTVVNAVLFLGIVVLGINVIFRRTCTVALRGCNLRRFAVARHSARHPHRRRGYADRDLAAKRLHGSGRRHERLRARQRRAHYQRVARWRFGHHPHPAHEQFAGSSARQDHLRRRRGRLDLKARGDEEEKPVHSVGADDVAAALKYDADKIIFVPGYGLAVAQAQNLMAELAGTLESQGKDVKFAIHPVAGRMPGHMNVLLAEADVSYDKLYDMEDINAEFPETDAVVVVGANDVVNPAANDKTQESPISGMPVLNVEQARQVIFVKRSLSPGFAGVDNPLFYDEDKTMMLFADAKQGLQDVVAGVKNG